MKNNEMKKFFIKNRKCYYFNDIIKSEELDFNNILIEEKSHWNILIYDISYKTLSCLKRLDIRFHKINGFIRIYCGTKYLKLFSPEKDYAIYDRTRFFVSLKSGITFIFSHYFAKIKTDSYDSLPIEKRLHNVITYEISSKWR